MNLIRNYLPLVLLLFTFGMAKAQNPLGELSGDFQNVNQFYVRDDRIGANTIQYLRQKSSSDAWLYLNYKLLGYEAIIRYDLFNNSPLLNPQQAYTHMGIGFWQLSKSIDKLQLTAGYFYDQFGSGTIFRAYEDRLIGIDYAVQGIHAQYNFSDNFYVKAFTGQQKGFLDLNTNEDTRFNVTPQVIKGLYASRFFKVNDKFSVQVEAGAVNRTLDQSTLDQLVTEINSMDTLSKRFSPKSNTYAYTGSVTLRYNNFTLVGEYNGKTKEAQRNTFTQELYNAPGEVIFGSLGYSRKGIGINFQYKTVKDFQFRTSPNTILLNGMISYLPSITRQNVYRLLARYTPAVQLMGETAYQGDVIWSPNKKLTFNLNLAYVDQSDKEKLYREAYFDLNYKLGQKTKLMLGVQYVYYNQRVYQLNPNAPDVQAITPFTEVTYKLSQKRSLRFECQYMHTEQDLGSFVNGLVEYNISPHWSFSAGDMVNVSPVRTPETPQETISDEIIHYYNFFVAYAVKNTRFTFNYLKQVQGVNCTGGICRVEPAFSGFKVGLTTTF